MLSAIMTAERKRECPLPFPGKKHKRSKAYSRFLLQMRLFCQKTCETYDFVLLFQFENAKTEISITHPLRRISSASADFCCAAKALSHSIYGVGPCGPAPFLWQKRRLFMALSVKTREHIRRWAALAGPKWGALLGGAAALAAAITFTGSALHFTTVVDTHGDTVRILTAAAAGRARRSRLVPDRGRGAAGRPARLHGAGHGGRRNAGADRHRHAHNGGAA